MELIKDVLKFGRPHCSQIQEHKEFEKILYVRSSMFRHLVWNQWSQESQHIPFWLILTGRFDQLKFNQFELSQTQIS